MSKAKYDVAVIGAGMVGASCAMWLTMHGFNVALIERNEPGSGTSYGNACSIATYACVPINSPKLLKQLPSLLFSQNTPLSIDWKYVVTHVPWMLKFLRNCSAARVDAIVASLGSLLRHTDAGLDPLIDAADAKDLFFANDFLNVYSTQAAFDAASDDTEKKRLHGSAIEILTPQQIRTLEPALKLPIYKGVLFKGVRHVKNPQTFVERICKHFSDTGGSIIKSPVSSVTTRTDGVTLTCENGKTIDADKCVIAAGAHSKLINGCGMEKIPLDTERGYHLQYGDHADLVSRPVGWAEGGFYASPTNLGLRCAGTVEIAGLNKSKNPERLRYLRKQAQTMFGEGVLGEPKSTWLGFRPTLSDSLPVIGESVISKNVLYAFGHQHIGLTLGGITGKIIADLISGKQPDVNVDAFSPRRFS